MAGYGVYFAIIEMLREQEDYTFNVSDIEDIAFDLGEDLDMVNSIINDFSLFTIEDNLFFSQPLINRMNDYNELKAKRIEAGKAGGKASAEQRSSKRSPKPKQPLSNPQALDYTTLQYTTTDYTTLEKTKELIKGAFDCFWVLYGKSADKVKCFDKFGKLELSEYNIIFKTLPNYIRSTPDVQFRKNPLTYLNGKCWNDEITAKPFHSPDVPDRTTVRPLYIPTAKDLD